MGRIDMHTLQEFVRLARMGTGYRAIARMLRISPNTEREYRKALEAAGLLAGEPGELVEPDVLQAALAQHKPARPPPQQVSTVERWSTAVSAMQELGAKPKAIDRLRLEHPDFTGSLSAIKRMCGRFEGQSPGLSGTRPKPDLPRRWRRPGQPARCLVRLVRLVHPVAQCIYGAPGGGPP